MTEFSTWLLNADLPDPAELLDGKVTFKHDARRIDRTAAVIGATSSLLINAGGKHPAAEDRKRVMWTLLRDISQVAMAETVDATRNLCNAGLAHGCDVAWQAIGKLSPGLGVAGLTSA
jgi:hypothetical protein